MGGREETLEIHLLFTVWLLAKPESLLAAGDQFDLPKSSGHGIFKNIVTILQGLVPQFIQWPNAGTYAGIANTFYERGRFPDVIGAIDGCHIAIKQPINNPVDYYNRKGTHSINLQGICDASGRFIDVFIGMPGRMHDARVFRNSVVYGRLTDANDPLLPGNYHILGDSAFPLMENVLTPYRDNGHLEEHQLRYKRRFCALRSIIGRCFGQLKCKFRRLHYLDVADPQFGNAIIAACDA